MVRGVALALGAAVLLPAADPQYFIQTVAGAEESANGPAVQARLGDIQGIALDGAGNLYLADAAEHRVWKVDVAAAAIAVFAGRGAAGFAGDGGPATGALLDRPYDVAVDAAGNVYIADLGNARVRRVKPDGAIETVAGGGSELPAMGMDARKVRLMQPRNVAVDSAGRLYLSDFAGHRVYAVTASGGLMFMAGMGIAGYVGEGVATQTLLNKPAGLAVDEVRGLYIADSENRRVRRVAGGRIETVIEDAPWPVGLAVDRDSVLYVAGVSSKSILRCTPGGEVTIVPAPIPLERPLDVAAGANGVLYVAEARRVWQVDRQGDVRRIAGADPYDGPVMGAEVRLLGPIGVAVDAAGDAYIAEEGRKAIRKLDGAGLLTTVASSGFGDPVGVVVNYAGEIWVADYLGNRVVKVAPGGAAVPVAGTGEAGFSGDNGPALKSRLNRPRGLAVDWVGNIYVADSGNHRVRMISPGGNIATVAGAGVRGRRGDGGPATSAELDTPAGVAVDGEGNLYIAEPGGHAIRRVDRRGLITTVAGSGQKGYAGDGKAATVARLDSPAGVAVDYDGNLFIADTGNHRIRSVDRKGVMRTIAGEGAAGFAGDGGLAHLARLRSPSSVAVDPDGRVYVADLENGRIRRLTRLVPPPTLDDVGDCSVVHGASMRPGPVAPGQIVTVYGASMGPELLIGGAPALVFYRDSGQINAQAPYGLVAGTAAEVEVLEDGRLRARCRVSVVAVAPGIFTVSGGSGQAAALNEDGTLNSAENPAPQGSILTFYATGEGRTAGEPLPSPVLPVDVRVAGLPVEVEYAGGAPGFVGLMQINVRLPAGLAPTGVLPLELIVGGVSSQPGVTIATR
jgi:uncharacterized protein (TIGR03437 family)